MHDLINASHNGAYFFFFTENLSSFVVYTTKIILVCFVFLRYFKIGRTFADISYDMSNHTLLNVHPGRTVVTHHKQYFSCHGNGCNGRTYFSTSFWMFEKHSRNHGNFLIYFENMVYSPPTALCFVLQSAIRLQNECIFFTCRGVDPSKNTVCDALWKSWRPAYTFNRLNHVFRKNKEKKHIINLLSAELTC